MSKGSNTTRSGGSYSTRATSVNGGGSSLAQFRQSLGVAVNKANTPALGSSKTYNLIENYKVRISHQPIAKGGAISYSLSQGGTSIYSGRYRYSEHPGRYDAETAKDATRMLHNDLISSIMDLKRNEE